MPTSENKASGAGDFDFFVGSWRGRQRRLRKILDGCDDWEEFTSTSQCWSLFDGAGNIDEVRFPELGSAGVTLRLFDPAKQEWSLYWASSRNGLLTLPPTVGRFTGGTGLFYDDETFEGREIRVRYTWSGITEVTARWEQAFSTDRGQTWETNWIADFTRQE
jgi:hypothetical protein